MCHTRGEPGKPSAGSKTPVAEAACCAPRPEQASPRKQPEEGWTGTRGGREAVTASWVQSFPSR